MRRSVSLLLICTFFFLILSPICSDPFYGASTILHDIRPSKGIVQISWLSEWFAPLKGTPSDTRVFIADSKKPGATVFVAGGTHANEIAGIISAVILVENAIPSYGRLIAIPDINMSASTWTESTIVPSWIRIDSPHGARFFKYGARYTDPVHQGMTDPDRYKHPKGGDSFEGSESRNLNRVYPGKPDGTLTEQLAWAVMTLLKKEKVDIAFDLHEAGPESRLANMIVANPKNLDLGALAVINLELEGINMKLEPSSDVFHGLSHREWGDETSASAFLIETPNPAQATDKGNPVEDPKHPLEERVAIHLATIEAILDAWNSDCLPDKHIEFAMFPSWQAIKARGVGESLNW